MALIKLLSPFRFYLLAAAATVMFLSGWKVRDWQCDAAYSAALEKANKAREKKQSIVDGAATTYENERSKAHDVTVERTHTIREIYRNTPPVSVNCSAPDNARRVLEDSVSDANAAASGKSGGELPKSTGPADASR